MPVPYHPVDDGTPVRKLEFVEVGAAPSNAPTAPKRRAVTTTAPDDEAFAPAETPALVSPGEPRWSLWGDAEL